MQTPKDYLREYIINNNIVFITPKQVVELATDPDSPLHDAFEWDDSIAASNYRIWQARALIASLKITVEKKPDKEVRLMVSVPSDRGEKGYQLFTNAIKNPSAKLEIEREIARWVSHWREQAELLESATLIWLNEYPAEDVLIPVALSDDEDDFEIEGGLIASEIEQIHADVVPQQTF